MSLPTASRSEGLLAARNAVSLGTSLAMTSGMALLVRMLIPRMLGPTAFGELRLAESFAEMLFVVLTFGVDLQLRLDAAVDPSGARRYLTGLTVLRVGLGALGIVGTAVVLRATGASTSLIAVFIFVAIAQVLLVLNNSYSALEHASGEVGWLARTNVGMKVIWAGAMFGVLFGLRTGLAVAAAGLAVEAVRFAWLTARARSRHHLQARPEFRLATGAILASVPFFVNSVAHNFYARIGTGWLGAMSSGFEVGLYGAASNLATIALIGMPLLAWVLVPSAARAAVESEAQMDLLVAGALRISLLVAVPVTLVFYFGAAPILGLLFGREYLAAAPILRILAPTFGLAYISTVCAIALLQQKRAWTVAAVSIAGLAVTVLLCATLIPWGSRHLGAAGAGQGAAWATLATEVVVTALLGYISRRSFLEATLLRTAAALSVGVAGILAAAYVMPLTGIGPVVLAVGVFVAVVASIGGINRDDITFVRQVLGIPCSTTPGTLALR